MAARDCIDEIKAAGGGRLTDDDVAVIVEELERRRQHHAATEALESVEERLFADAARLAAETERAALIEKRNALLNRQAKARRRAVYRAAGDDPVHAMEAINVGVNRPIPGVGQRLSVDARAQGLESGWLGGLIADLRRENLLEVWNRGLVSDDVARELFEIRADGGGRPGVTGNAQARAIAGIVHKWQRAGVARMNRAGASIGSLDGYIVRQGHDADRLRRAGYMAWRDVVLPRLDRERTFGDADDIEKFLKGAYDGLASGVHKRADLEPSDRLFAFTGPGNLAKRASAERVLHFASADAWLEYNARFGTGTVEESVLRGMRHAARTTALLEVWGTNPRAAFDADLAELRAEHRDRPKVSDRLAPGRLLDRQFRTVSGEADISVGRRLAEVGRTVRALQSMAKLGGVLLSSISDIPFRAAEMRWQGESLLSSYAAALGDVVKGRRTASEQREVADLIGAGIDGMVGDLAGRFASTDSVPGAMGKLMQRFFKLNGLAWWTDSHKTGVGLIMARRLAQERGLDWDGLADTRRRALAAYGIGAAEWELLRAAPVRTADGLEFVTPGSAREISDEDALAWAAAQPGPKVEPKTESARARAAERARDELETRLAAYFSDRIDHAVLTPGARERTITTGGVQAGTVEGEAIRFVMQFKAFPTTVLSKAWGREIYASGKADMLGIAHLVIGTTVMGYVAMSAKDMVKGRSPRDPLAPATWAAAMVQGGGAGIYGDFLLGTKSRFGGGALDTLLGPTFGTAQDVVDVWTRLRDGDDAAAAALRTAVSNTPFANLFYTRAALDYLVLYHIQEAMNPGYLQRFERRVEKENRQSFILRPSSVVATGGGFR